MEVTRIGGDPYVAQTLDFLETIFANYSSSDFAFRLWDGTIWQKENAEKPTFTIVLNHPSALRRMFLPPTDSRLGEAYILAYFDIEGQIFAALSVGQKLWETWTWRDTLRNALKLLWLPSGATDNDGLVPQLSGERHSVSRDMRAIQYHYDVSNDFFRLWLDKQMVYSCAYFADPEESIDTAQARKLDYICRKLRLQPGERMLDIGCGWGALIIHAAKNYGVVALGVTLSEKQLSLARKNIREHGVEDRCMVELLDYRNVDEEEPFDKIVSVGMVEHVGRNNLKTYFEKAYNLLRPGGVFLNHGITLLHAPFQPLYKANKAFFQRYIFPDGDIQPLNYVLDFAVQSKFEIRDVECLREHYALTLKCWLQRFESHEKAIKEMVGPKTYRLWRLYLLAAGWGFEIGDHTIYQTLLYKASESGSAKNDLPLTRDDWYGKAHVDGAAVN